VADIVLKVNNKRCLPSHYLQWIVALYRPWTNSADIMCRVVSLWSNKLPFSNCLIPWSKSLLRI